MGIYNKMIQTILNIVTQPLYQQLSSTGRTTVVFFYPVLPWSSMQASYWQDGECVLLLRWNPYNVPTNCKPRVELSCGVYTGRNNVFPYFVNSTETASCLYPSRFRPAETWWPSFPWTGRVFVMFPLRKRTNMFLPHFWYNISVLSCFRYVSGEVFFFFFFFFYPCPRSQDQCFRNFAFAYNQGE